MLSSEKKKAAL